MRTQKIQITATEYTSIEELPQKEKATIEASMRASEDAWAPYSKFKVGAAVLLENGKIVIGNNQENAAYPSGLCAERVALFSAHAQYPNSKVICLAICAQKDHEFLKEPISPCGSCRQVIMETNQRFANPMKVIMYGSEKIISIENSNLLLPLGFNSESI